MIVQDFVFAVLWFFICLLLFKLDPALRPPAECVGRRRGGLRQL